MAIMASLEDGRCASLDQGLSVMGEEDIDGTDTTCRENSCGKGGGRIKQLRTKKKSNGKNASHQLKKLCPFSGDFTSSEEGHYPLLSKEYLESIMITNAIADRLWLELLHSHIFRCSFVMIEDR